MKVVNYLLAILFVSLVIVSCNQKQTGKESLAGVEYYRNLQFSETPFDIEKGTHPLTPEEAKTINSYKFTKDSLGRLVSVEFVRNDKLLGYSGIRGAAKITYTYSGNKQIKHFFNKNNEPIEPEGVYTAEYTLDSAGLRTGLKFYSKDGQPVENRNKIHSYVWTKLPDGMIRELRYNLANEETVMNPFCPFYELRFTYNDKGYVTRMANYKADTLYNCTAENCGDIGVSYFTFSPNEKGDLLKFAVFNVYGQMSNLYWGWSKRENKVDDNGYLLEASVYDQDNEYVGGKNIPITAYKYDEHGALTEVTNMDKNRKIINDPENGIAVIRYSYDDLGNPKDTLRFDKNMVAVVKK